MEISIAGIDVVNKQMKTMDKEARKVQRSIATLGRGMEKTGKAMTKYITVPIALAGAAVIKFGADFDKAMTSSLAIMGEVSAAMKKDMSDAAREVGKTTKFSATEAAEAYYFLASAGLSAKQSIEALPKVAAFAQAGQFDLSLATDLLTDAQSALGLVVDNVAENMENMTRVSDVLVKANTLSNASVQLLSEALTNKAGAALKALGKDVEEGVAVLAAFAAQGVKGAEAGTKLFTVLRDLQTASIKNSEAFKRAGIAVYDENEEMRNMADIISDLENRLEGMSKKQKKAELMTLGFTDKSIAATTALLGTSDAIKEYETKLKDAAGTTDEVSKKQLQNFWDQLNLVKSELIDIGLTIWQSLEPILTKKLIPALKKVTTFIKSFADWLDKLDRDSKDFILTLLAFVVAYGPVLMMLGKALIATRLLTTSILTMNAALLANPFVLAGIAAASFILILKGIKDAYDDNIKAHQKWVAITTTQAQQSEFIKSTEKLMDSVMAHKDTLKDVDKFTKKYGKTINEVSEQARKMGFVIEGDASAKFQQLNNILMFLNNTFDKTGKLVFKTREELDKANEKLAKGVKKVKKVTDEDNDTTEKNIALTKELIQQRIAETDSLKAQEFQKIKLLELERKERVAKVKETGEDVNKINKLYARKKIQIEKETADKIKEIQDKALEDEKKIEEERIRLLETKKKKIKNFFEDWAKEEELFTQEQLEKFFRLVNTLNDITGQMGAIVSQYYYNKFALMDQNEQKEIKAVENSLMSEEEKETALVAIEKKFAKERSKLKKEQAKKDKAIAIFSAIINTAAAVVKTFADWGWPLGLVFGLIMGALGAAQIALIASEPLPMRRGAYVKGGRGGVQAEIGEGTEDEIVMPMKTGVQALAEALVNKLNDIKLPETRTPALAMAGGGTMTTGARGGRIENHWHIGTLVADESGIKELERRLNPYRIADEQRKGRAYHGSR